MLSKVKDILNRALGRSDIVMNNDLYMRRWRLIHNRFFGVRVHCIHRSDIDRDLHDHPFSFMSILLRGSYVEETVDGNKRQYGAGSILFRSAEALHRLEVRDPVWTLVIRGPSRRDWGFLTSRGWVTADDYERIKRQVWNRGNWEMGARA